MDRSGRSLRVVLGLVCLVPAATCQTPLSPRAATYLDAALDIMQAHSLHKYEIVWADVRREAREHAAGAETEADTYEAIRFALRGLGDHHSFLQLSPEGMTKDAEARARRRDKLPLVSTGQKWPPSPYIGRDTPGGVMEMIEGVGVARLIVPSTGAPDLAAMRLYANELGAAVSRLAVLHPAGWIVDLRGNLGGNMWPMLAGMEPLLHGNELGSFIDADGRREVWFVDASGAGTRTTAGRRLVACPAPVSAVKLVSDAPVAVLVDRGSASAAEAVAIAFIGRPGTQLFGRHTAGQSTGNRRLPLLDGARLVLTEVAEADRSGHVYRDGITPDVVLPEEQATSEAGVTDPMTQAAGRWIAAQRVNDGVSNARATGLASGDRLKKVGTDATGERHGSRVRASQPEP